MIGSGLKKYAVELGLKISDGIAYGAYKNYLITLHEGSGWKAVGIAVTLTDQLVMEKVDASLSDPEWKKQYRIQQINIAQNLIEIIFADFAGTVKKLKSALEIILDKLLAYQVPGVSHCSYCKNAFDGNHCQIVKIGNYAYGMHDACIRSLENELVKNIDENKDNGSIGRGVAGAAAGAVIGAIPWAVVYYFGWFVGWLGFVIGIAAKKGYELFKGRETKVKAVVIIIVTMLAVVLAEYATCVFAFWRAASADPELASMHFSIGEIFSALNYAIITDSEVLTGMIVDIALGWVFAGLGIYSTIKNIFTGTSTKKPVLLDDPARQSNI